MRVWRNRATLGCKWMRAQRPPCPCHFHQCLALAEEEALWAYFHVGLSHMEVYHARTMTAVVEAEAVAPIDQVADLNTHTSDGRA